MARPEQGVSGRVQFGAFVLDLRSGELRGVGLDAAADKTVLREQPFQILRMLIEAAGTIVTRSEIKQTLWPNDTIVDFDHSINVAIGVLRRALADSAASPRYIETLARRGYRLLVAVERLDMAVQISDADAVASETFALGDWTGTKVGHYRVLEMLGGGGMGMVYKAEDLKLGRRVALKFLPEELASDPAALQRLEREAQTASALNHPNICTIHDIEEFSGQLFIAMELLEGETLLEHLAALAPRPTEPLSLVDIAVQVCAGLQAAHDKDIVHRDIKPGNIFLTKQGAVKVLDFGIAKQVASPDRISPGGGNQGTQGAHRGAETGLTRTGASVGTTGYMSPEQVRKEPLDGRSDLFSLGLVLYEMATGRRAFTGETADEVQAAIVAHTPPPARVVNAALPGALDTIIGKALEKDRTRRYQTATDLQDDLERARLPMRSPPRTHRRPKLAAAALLLLSLASGMWLWSRRDRGAAVTLSPGDTIVLAHIANDTGDGVFGAALYAALRIGLEQTPYLNVLGDYKVLDTLKGIGKGNPAIVGIPQAIEVCRVTNSKMVVAASIANAGNRFRIELEGLDCKTGATVIRVQRDTVSRDAVIHSLGEATTQLRARLGEAEVSVEKFNTRLDEATSASPEAVELLIMGYRRQLGGDSHEALSYYERASKLDPLFALAHSALSSVAASEDRTDVSIASARTAFELRNRLTAPARFQVESKYHGLVTGDQEKAREVLSEWVQTFPHDLVARMNFALCLSDLGELDRSLGETREALRLFPAAWVYRERIVRSILVDRYDEAVATFDEALERGFDSAAIRSAREFVAFLQNDAAATDAQWKWAESTPEAMRPFLAGRARAEAYRGQFRRSRGSEEAAATAAAGDGVAFIDPIAAILMRADAGLSTRPAVIAATNSNNHGLEAQLLLAMTLARNGQVEQSEVIARALRQGYPSHTLLQKYALPMIEAAVMLRSNDGAAAIAALRPAAKYELSNWGPLPNLYSAYLRGLACLQMRDGTAAAVEFQKILAHPGLVGREVIAALAWLQLARAQHLAGEDAASLKSYQHFLTLWRDADADVPIYQEATIEFRRQREIVRHR